MEIILHDSLRYIMNNRNKANSNKSNSIKLNSKNISDAIANIKLPKYFPQVSVLTNRILKETPLDKFVWLEKTDGTHYNILIYDNKMYYIRKHKENSTDVSIRNADYDIIYIKDVSLNQGLTILDTELYNNKYYVFDASMIENNDISSQGYIERMKITAQYLNKNDLTDIIIKQFEPIESLSSLLTYINTNETSPSTGNDIDGVILQRIDLPYYYSESTCYKLKRTVMNTIDFKLFYEQSEKTFYLYLWGSYLDVIRNRKKLPKINKYSKAHTGVDLKGKLPNKLYVLFASPYEEGLHKFKPRRDWNTDGYFKSNITAINYLMDRFITNPLEMNGAIVEMSKAKDGWVPLRIRYDKQYPNGYNVGLSNASVLFNPIDADFKPYFSKELSFNEDIIKPYHDINRNFRKYIIEHSINPLHSKLTVLDLAGGRGGDIVNLYNSGACLIFAVDADKDALVQYVERVVNVPSIKYKNISDDFKPIENKPKSILINAIHAYLNDDNTNIINEIKYRFEYPSKGFDVILMNYAIHYLCYNKKCISALNTLLKSLLKPNGLFIFTYFDGDAILYDMNGNKELQLNSFKIKLIEKDEVDTGDIESDDDAVWAMMPLPTIDASGYRCEPLVTSKYLKLLELETIYNGNVIDSCDVNNIEDNEKVTDYLKYIRYAVMRKE